MKLIKLLTLISMFTLTSCDFSIVLNSSNTNSSENISYEDNFEEIELNEFLNSICPSFSNIEKMCHVVEINNLEVCGLFSTIYSGVYKQTSKNISVSPFNVNTIQSLIPPEEVDAKLSVKKSSKSYLINLYIPASYAASLILNSSIEEVFIGEGVSNEILINLEGYTLRNLLSFDIYDESKKNILKGSVEETYNYDYDFNNDLNDPLVINLIGNNGIKFNDKENDVIKSESLTLIPCCPYINSTNELSWITGNIDPKTQTPVFSKITNSESHAYYIDCPFTISCESTNNIYLKSFELNGEIPTENALKPVRFLIVSDENYAIISPFRTNNNNEIWINEEFHEESIPEGHSFYGSSINQKFISNLGQKEKTIHIFFYFDGNDEYCIDNLASFSTYQLGFTFEFEAK